MRVPIFLINGVLESGKTAFIQTLVEKPAFGDGEVTLLICCEDGEAQYNKDVLIKQNVVKVVVDEEEEFNDSLLAQLESKYQPKRVIIELNGMWNVDDVLDVNLPNTWALYQSVVIVNGETFNLYVDNMRGIFVDHFKLSDLVVINRVSESTDLLKLKGLVKTLSPTTNILISNDNFEMKVIPDELPYDINQDMIKISPEYYGIWYMDLWENKGNYNGKSIEVMGLFFQSPSDPKDRFHFGRFAMPCCEDDTTFLGVYCKNIGKPKFKNKDSIKLRADIRWESADVYEGEGPVLYVKDIEKIDDKQEEFVMF